MKLSEERRAPHAPRVPLTTLVDICTQAGDMSPFQGESANLSGLGMQVRTSYLPSVGDELVCRLMHDDHEILVEGRVAWRSEGQDSGEFGIQFTALDADSADVIQSLGEKATGPGPSAYHDRASDAEESGTFSEGSRVKLHIDGLGAPMKACVHEGSQRKLRVGSCLEFLRVGRELEVEDVVYGTKRGAHVDSVNVVINPSTSIPELVVQLRYEGASSTPPPAKVRQAAATGYEDEEFISASRPGKQSARATRASEEEGFSDEDAAPWETSAEALRARLGGAMHSAAGVAQKAGDVFGAAVKSARESVASRMVQKPVMRRQNTTETRGAIPPSAKRRQTTRHASSVAPSHLRSGVHELGLLGKHRSAGEAARTNAPSARASAAPQASPLPNRKLPPAVYFGVAFVLLGGSALAFRGAGPDAPAAQSEQIEPAQAVIAPAVAQVAAPVPSAPKGELVAEVPLFGPQAMAQKPAEEAPAAGSVADAERRAAAAAVQDESWEDAPTPEPEVETTAPWGRGKLYLPTIHRLRLDGEGAQLSGAVNSAGFTVVIPGRKSMESGKSIESRDKRILGVSSTNGARGATVKFEFRGAVPAYRVRLRKDFVEFLISAPEDSVAQL